MEKYFKVKAKNIETGERTFKIVLIDVNGQLTSSEVEFIEKLTFFKNKSFKNKKVEKITLACGYNSTGEFIEYVSIL